MNPVDPRAGKLCTNCNAKKPDDAMVHCMSPSCTWWRCRGCRAVNDPQGRNDRISPSGVKKWGEHS